MKLDTWKTAVGIVVVVGLYAAFYTAIAQENEPGWRDVVRRIASASGDTAAMNAVCDGLPARPPADFGEDRRYCRAYVRGVLQTHAEWGPAIESLWRAHAGAVDSRRRLEQTEAGLAELAEKVGGLEAAVAELVQAVERRAEGDGQ